MKQERIKLIPKPHDTGPRSLPKSASNYVREKEPTSACQAAEVHVQDELKYSKARQN